MGSPQENVYSAFIVYTERNYVLRIQNVNAAAEWIYSHSLPQTSVSLYPEAKTSGYGGPHRRPLPCLETVEQLHDGSKRTAYRRQNILFPGLATNLRYHELCLILLI